MKKLLVFTATYNEAENITTLVPEVFKTLPDCDMLVVDDDSPDGTGKILEQLKITYPRLHIIHRPGKSGLGSAHKLAIKYALTENYEALITMDADFSHDPKYLPEMVQHLEKAEFVIGSRYIEGGGCEYGPFRTALSVGANALARTLLSLPLHETTTAYRGYRRALLEKMDMDAIHAEGYSYFIESIYRVTQITSKLAEFPIIFVDRRAGSSKISKKEIWNGLTTVFRLFGNRLQGKSLRPSRADRR
ncbi:polyprenol monophosphomannose synthase [Bdellovibrionota bacterium FG-1]